MQGRGGMAPGGGGGMVPGGGAWLRNRECMFRGRSPVAGPAKRIHRSRERDKTDQPGRDMKRNSREFVGLFRARSGRRCGQGRRGCPAAVGGGGVREEGAREASGFEFSAVLEAAEGGHGGDGGRERGGGRDWVGDGERGRASGCPRADSTQRRGRRGPGGGGRRGQNGGEEEARAAEKKRPGLRRSDQQRAPRPVRYGTVRRRCSEAGHADGRQLQRQPRQPASWWQSAAENTRVNCLWLEFTMRVVF